MKLKNIYVLIQFIERYTYILIISTFFVCFDVCSTTFYVHIFSEDEELYARGLANYGLQTQHQMRQLHQQIHEPIYVGYSPDTTTSTIYGTSSRQHQSSKKVPPKVPPKPSINALLGIGIVVPPPSSTSSQQLNSRSNSTSDIYGNTKATRHISHV